MRPLVTVVIAAYNAEKYIGETLASILRQTWEKREIIVVDDGSTDATPRIIKEAGGGIAYIRQENSGNCASPRNLGLRQARGAYVNFFDADDIMHPRKIEDQVRALDAHPDAAMVIGDYENFSDDRTHPSHFTTCPLLSRLLDQYGVGRGESILLQPPVTTTTLLRENFGSACSPLYATHVVRDLGGYDEELSACEDFLLNYRIAAQAPTVVLNAPGYRRRLHAENMTGNFQRMMTNYIRSREKLLRMESSPLNRRLLKNLLASYHLNFAAYNPQENENRQQFRQAMKSLKYLSSFDRRQGVLSCKLMVKILLNTLTRQRGWRLFVKNEAPQINR
ncbi:MAG: glycosyltransferase [Desulfuromonadales bacterium]